MKKSKLISILAISVMIMFLFNAFLLTACVGKRDEEVTEVEEVSTEESDEIADSVDMNLVDANTGFGFNIFKELTAEDEDSNVFISPLSILLALAMTYNGAVGDTNLDMAEALGFNEFDLEELNSGFHNLLISIMNADSDIELSIANSIWYKLGYGVNQDFIDRNEKYYSSEVNEIDFAAPGALDTINGWIADAIKGKIEKMLDVIPTDAMMYLINAIYFKGNWTYPFNEDVTVDDDFYLLDGTTKKVPMMSQEGNFAYFDGDGFSAVKLLYGQEKMAMYIILPDEGMELDSVIESLNEKSWNEITQSFYGTEVSLVMPKYKMEYGVKLLNDVLTNLGMGIAFGAEADFSGIYPDIWISRVLHKAVIEVNEKGSEAAAATVVEMEESAMEPTEIVEFIVNRPFFFMIGDDRSGSILFMGKVVEP
ncbi:MAG: serpin family protein [Actinomycetota bacterium]